MNDSPLDPVDEHVVFFSTAQGEPAAERYPSLRAAVRRVEALCNDHDVRDATVFRLVPVPLNVKSYYRVEIGEGRADGSEPVRDSVADGVGAAGPDDTVRGAHAAVDRPEAPAQRAEVSEPVQPVQPIQPVPPAGQADRSEPSDSLDARDLRMLRERRPMREMREEIAPQPRSGEAPAVEGAESEADAAADERGRSLGFFIR